MRKRPTLIPAILCTALSGIAMPIWLGLILVAFALGGSPGPGYERSVPGTYIGVIALGLLGALLALIAGIIGFTGKPARKILSLCAALFGASGSVPFFLLDVAAVGLFALLVGILSPLLYLLLSRTQGLAKEG